jgi:hypothetical protein
MSKRHKMVKIGGHVCEVRYTKDLRVRDDDGNDTDRGANGFAWLQERLLEMDAGLSGTVAAETFLHELIHLLDYDRHLRLSERQTDQLAAALLGAIVDNPRWFGTHYLEQFEPKG